MGPEIGDRPETNNTSLTTIGTDKEELIFQYAAGEIAWSTVRERGIDRYVDVLAGGLGRLGLRPPIAPPGRPNRGARARGGAIIREALEAPMTRRLGLVVTDASPSIMLAAAGALESLRIRAIFDYIARADRYAG